MFLGTGSLRVLSFSQTRFPEAIVSELPASSIGLSEIIKFNFVRITLVEAKNVPFT